MVMATAIRAIDITEAIRRRPTMGDTIPIRGAATPPPTTAAGTRRLTTGLAIVVSFGPRSPITVVPMRAASSTTIAGIATTGDHGSSKPWLGSERTCAEPSFSRRIVPQRATGLGLLRGWIAGRNRGARRSKERLHLLPVARDGHPRRKGVGC